MIRCRHCSLDAKYKVIRRFNAVPIRPLYLCEIHRKRFERVQDFLLISALVLTLALFVISFMTDQANKNEVATVERIQESQVFAEKDLDRDGRISWFEEQVTTGQMAYFRELGYPFTTVLSPTAPTRALKRRIDVAALLQAVREPTPENQIILTMFPHPKLMKAFLDKYSAPDAKPNLQAVMLTHDGELAFVLLDTENEQNSRICLERLAPDQETEIEKLALDKEPAKKK
jgi:hypothetical protein